MKVHLGTLKVRPATVESYPEVAEAHPIAMKAHFGGPLWSCGISTWREELWCLVLKPQGLPLSPEGSPSSLWDLQLQGESFAMLLVNNGSNVQW
jgi:hypothetical protein